MKEKLYVNPENDSLLKLIVREERVNDIRFLNKYFEKINKNLKNGGVFKGNVETCSVRANRILKKYIFPFNKNKWALITATNYQHYKNTQELEAQIGQELVTQTASVSYQSVELSFGLRYYMFLNSNSKIFLNAIGVSDFNLDSGIDYERSRSDYEIKTKMNANTAFGLGYNFKKFSAELRIYSSRDLLWHHISAQGDYNNLSFIIGYNIL